MTTLTKKYRTFVPATGELPDPLYDYQQSITYHYNNDAAEYDTAEQVVAEIVSDNILLLDVPELPESGMIEADKLYSWNGIVIRCRQTHQRTIYDPTATLALFTIYRPESTDMGCIAGEQVDVGTLRIYDGVTYECIQTHVTQSDWTPDSTPALWKVYEEPAGTDEWAAGVTYKVGDIVTYEGNTYKCLQAHTSISTWYPSVVPALWQLQ